MKKLREKVIFCKKVLFFIEFSRKLKLRGSNSLSKNPDRKKFFTFH
ncbi:protein of unknown function [Ruminococcaceae bacterium BL-4]|nr:protein of unknown function [Ruminococcaceae bacterium BL-4]